MPKDNGSKNLKILCRPLFFILWFITLSSWEKGSGKKYELVPFVCIFKICPSTDTSWSLHSRYNWPKDTTQNFCSQKLLFPDHFKYEFEHNISIHQFLCHQKLFIMSHWTLISLYYCLETNQGEHNVESASKINVGSLCNRYLALRRTKVDSMNMGQALDPFGAAAPKEKKGQECTGRQFSWVRPRIC